MAEYRTGDIHNVMLAGLRSVGKTTLAEALLFAAGAIDRQGSVEQGTSASDFQAEEQAHHHSVYAALLHADHAGKRINIVDVPGASDLVGQAYACLPAVETLVLVMTPDSGVDRMSSRLMKKAQELDLPRSTARSSGRFFWRCRNASDGAVSRSTCRASRAPTSSTVS
jgi:elongation factor G